VYPEHTIVIGAVHDKKYQELFFRGQPWSQEKWDEMQAAMRKASLILATHEHFDHVGGIATSPYLDEILDRVLLTRRQIEGFTMQFSGFPDGTLERLKPLDYETYHSPAPGVVLIQAPGHSSGHQFVYIRLESGHEFLYVGDSVWEKGNITHLSGRPRLISLLIMEDHSQSANQIRLLSNGLADESFPHILISHDGDQISQYQEQGLLGKGFL
jgi:glyoxylase-like metal-dependent hydrolase (beta-lactamase superfamily II)